MLFKANSFTWKLLNYILSKTSIAVPHVQCAIKSHKWSLKVDFLFQSFLVITVPRIPFFLSSIITNIKKKISRLHCLFQLQMPIRILYLWTLQIYKYTNMFYLLNSAIGSYFDYAVVGYSNSKVAKSIKKSFCIRAF